MSKDDQPLKPLHRKKLPQPSPDVVESFQVLAETWRQATGHFSDDLRTIGHPAYQAIIRMGPDVVPLILHELEARRGHWFAALRAITHEEPDRMAASVSQAREAWLQWGRQHDYL